MDSQRQKWVNISFLAVALLLGYIVFTFLTQIAGTYDLEARVRHAEMIIRGLAILAAAVLFFVLYRHEQANQFMHEVVVELTRVTWPAQKETSRATVVVIIMVIISGMILGGLDALWAKAIHYLMNLFA